MKQAKINGELMESAYSPSLINGGVVQKVIETVRLPFPIRPHILDEDDKKHKCSPECILLNPTAENIQNLQLIKRLPLLAVPLFFCWKRLLSINRIVYFSPCGSRFEDINQLNRCLKKTGFNLSIDYFDFSTNLDPRRALVSTKVDGLICEDFSNGLERFPITVVNSFDTDRPIIQEYVVNYVFDTSVTDEIKFDVCCTCTDGCQDKMKCKCARMTQKKAGSDKCTNLGYQMKKLTQQLHTGVWECNANCKCNANNCINRVIQNGSQHQLQIFKTDQKGWGVRTCFDIPAGSFVCTYTGRIITGNKADEIGKEGLWHYFADLDPVIFNGTTSENNKPKKQLLIEEIANKMNQEQVVSSTTSEIQLLKSPSIPKEHSLIKDFRKCISAPDYYEKFYRLGNRASKLSVKITKTTLLETTQFLPMVSIVRNPRRIQEKKVDTSNDVSDAARKKLEFHKDGGNLFFMKNKRSRRMKYKNLNIKKRARYNLKALRKNVDIEEEQPLLKPPRPHVVDGMNYGNIGRFINHSCEPNLLSQYVFTYTHSVKFPILAFFSKIDLSAGTELTWDYSYEKKDGRDTVIKCTCGSQSCTGVLY